MTFTSQSCQPLRFGRSLLRPRALHYIAMLMIFTLSLRKTNKIIFDPMCVGIRFASNWLRMYLFCATANRHSRFNQLTNHSVRFNSCSYASLPGKTTSIFNHFKLPCQSEKLKASPRVVNLVQKTHTKLSGKSIIQKRFCALYDQRRAPSM